MGTFGKSFTREMGKNTGKVVSNVLFGDWHSTPYRRVGATQYREPRKTQAELRHEQRMEQIEAEERLRLTQIQEQNKMKQKEQLLLIDTAVLQNIDKIATLRIPNDKEDLIHLLSELSTHLNANKFQKEKNEETKIRNKFTSALFEKYEQCVLSLKSIDPESLQLKHFERIAKKYKWKKFRTKHIVLFVFMCIFGFSISLSLIGFLLENLIVAVPVIIGVSILIFGTKFYLRNRKKSNEQPKQTENQSSKQEERKIIPVEEQVIQEENSIFIDLNENSRIETKLSGIWNRYQNSVDKKIIERKPIFSADGVKDSILFVGVNPSYNPNDDNVFVHSADNKTLMYGSLYQLSDAPKYFKSLEQFAAKAGRAYSHINLLYARENDRDLLVHCDHNFIREQLELTYDTILKINPVAIIFFTDYCKDLIFAHWVDSNNSRAGSYILNGTHYPVFFTADITLLDETEKRSLIQKIQQFI